MSTKRLMWGTPWLFAGTFVFFAACGDTNAEDDDDDTLSPTTTVGSTGQTGATASNVNAGNVTVGSTTSAFGNGVTTGVNTSTTGGTLVQMNDNCDNIVAEDGAACSVSGLFCPDAFGRGCVCGGSSRFPEGVWTCRGTIDASGGAPGAGGADGTAGAAGAGLDGGEGGNN